MSLRAVMRLTMRMAQSHRSALKLASKSSTNTTAAVALNVNANMAPYAQQTALLHRSSTMMSDLSYEDLVALIQGGNLHLIDVREPSEIEETGKIPGAVNIPLGQVKPALLLHDQIFQERFRCEKPLQHDSNLIFYGLGPIKSRAALELARKAGYKSCREYSGGFEDWMKHNAKIEK